MFTTYSSSRVRIRCSSLFCVVVSPTSFDWLEPFFRLHIWSLTKIVPICIHGSSYSWKGFSVCGQNPAIKMHDQKISLSDQFVSICGSSWAAWFEPGLCSEACSSAVCLQQKKQQNDCWCFRVSLFIYFVVFVWPGFSLTCWNAIQLEDLLKPLVLLSSLRRRWFSWVYSYWNKLINQLHRAVVSVTWIRWKFSFSCVMICGYLCHSDLYSVGNWRWHTIDRKRMCSYPYETW